MTRRTGGGSWLVIALTLSVQVGAAPAPDANPPTRVERTAPDGPRPGDSAPVVPKANHRRLTEILDRDEFSTARVRESDALQRLWQRVRAWFWGLLETSGAEGFSLATRFVVLVAALALALAAALRLVGWRARAKRQARGASEGGGLTLHLEDPSIHLGHATAAREPREQIREGLLALLSTLERARLARPDRVKTNRELASELPRRGASPELSRQVTELLRWYDQTFYSLDPVAPRDARKFVEDVRAVDAALTRSAA